MKKIVNRRGRRFISMMVIAMVTTIISALLITNVGAIAPGMTARNPGTVNNSSLPSTLEYGQVATAKNVSGAASTNFGDGDNGQFSVILSAMSRSYEGEQLITDAGVLFKDKFEDEYAFVASAAEMKIYIDDTVKTAVFNAVTGHYEYSEYFNDGTGPANLIQVTFDPVAYTVEYIIGERCLKYMTSSESTATPSSLEFGVRLKDSVATPGTYNTNLPNSCTAEFNALRSNGYYYQISDERNYTNVTRTSTTVYKAAHFNPPWATSDFDIFRIYLEYVASSNQYYQFNRTDGNVGIALSTRTGEETTENHYWYDLWVNPGIYTGLHPGDPLNSDIIEVLSPFSFTVHFDIVARRASSINYEGTINKLSPLPTPEFTIITRPNTVGEVCSVGIGGVTYTGACTSRTDASHWSFTSAEGYLITLLDEYDLKVVYKQSGWKNTTKDENVLRPLDAYGYITLSAPYIPPATRTLTVAKNVTGVTPSPNEKFAITVTFTPGGTERLNVLGISASNGAVNNNGVFALSLSASDLAVTFSNIPVGTTYSITEAITEPQDEAGWSLDTLNSKNISGTIDANNVEAVVVNDKAGVQGTSDVSPSSEVKGEKDTAVLPTTGGISASTLLGIIGLAIIIVGGTAFTIFRKKFLD